MLKLILMTLLWLGANAVADEAPTQSELRQQGLGIARQFAGQLKPKLQAAMQTGGAAHAIEVCSVQAPAIAVQLSESTGWSVRRVSLKARNKSSAQPDVWEAVQLKNFDAAVEQDQPPVAVSAWVGEVFRLMQPQLAGGICLGCHGQEIAPAVQAALDQYYPADSATGYEMGQVRGAISLRWQP